MDPLGGLGLVSSSKIGDIVRKGEMVLSNYVFYQRIKHFNDRAEEIGNVLNFARSESSRAHWR